MSVRIVVDSTCDVTQEIKEKLHIVPLTICFGEEEFIDGVTIDYKTFYEKLIETDVMPTTSQAAPDAFAKEFQKAADAGDEVVCLTVASRLSGTYQSAVIAAMDYPDRVFVIDTQTAAIGSGILAELAVSLAESGKSAAEIAQILNRERENVHLIAMVDTLEYLKRGGRISKAVAFAGELLSIKPVICVREGEIKILGKARGSRQAGNLLVKEIEAAGGVDFTKPVLLGYTGLSDHLLQKYIHDSAKLWEESPKALDVTPICSVIGTHAGPGAIAAAFFCK